MKNFFSRYHIRYIRSLVYMAQASEYNTQDFLRWFWRTRDFLHVEQRKKLERTPKTIVFLVLLHTLAAILYAFALWVVLVGTVWWRFLAGPAVALLTPSILAYCTADLLFLWKFIQWPVEAVIVRHARQKLVTHKAVKIAIAGSFGKTSMREILKTVLSAGKKVAAPPGSYNTPLGISSFVRKLRGDEDVLVFELGEYYPGDVKRLCALVQPDIGVITGVNEAHLEKFKDISRTQATVFELADYLHASVIPAKAGIQKGLLYVNGENEAARSYASDPVLYTRSGAGAWHVERAQTGLQGTSFTLKGSGKEVSVRSGLLGLHNVGPIIAAADIALQLGLTAAEIEKGIDATKPFEHRLEPHTDAQGVVWLDDSYNGNPDGVRAVIEFLSSLKGRRWYVTPGLVEMGSKKEEVHKEIGRQLARAGIEKVVLVRNSVTSYIAEGLQEEKYSGEVMWFDKALDAFAALPNLTVKGDVVLLQNDWPDQYA
ncbi:MAG: UDP-N-acetylmuramoyl-tripeptide--D-alanyl-D-alanine ligase [bacterium]|nr:UDP-N-acetylmuramoyl-tripeptide--D-alanyl-D-alanine ligase [bacterium]